MSGAAPLNENLYRAVRALCSGSRHFYGGDETLLQGHPKTLLWRKRENRTCGDSLTLALTKHPDHGIALCYAGSFCALCHATTELICRGHALGLTVFSLRSDIPAPSGPIPGDIVTEQQNITGNLAALHSAVSGRPSRTRCVQLPTEALADLGGSLPVEQT
jgi:hypothetical protein